MWWAGEVVVSLVCVRVLCVEGKKDDPQRQMYPGQVTGNKSIVEVGTLSRKWEENKD